MPPPEGIPLPEPEPLPVRFCQPEPLPEPLPRPVGSFTCCEPNRLLSRLLPLEAVALLWAYTVSPFSMPSLI